uniref:GPN-loop GTPase n=1 Tax=Sinocyclocheilus grahami TaxID=75366 RepID=A0A672KPT6_SINGR
YVINLDPAVHEVPFPANIGIRWHICTLLCPHTSFIEKKQSNHQYVLIDTPGQIEVFTWSASGTIITEALASSFPCVIYNSVFLKCIVCHFVFKVTVAISLLCHCRSVTHSFFTGSGLDELFVQVADAAKEYETYIRCISYFCIHLVFESDSSLALSPKMMHASFIRWHIWLFYSSEAPDLGGPSDLIFTRGNPDEDEEDTDSDTDDIDHTVTEESKEAGAFSNFLKERKETVQVRNRKSK